MTFGVLEENIINAGVAAQINATWLANLRHVEEHGADFFVTGNEYTREGVNLDYLPCVCEDKTATLGGVNLADDNQDLRQSFLTAQHVFKKVKRGTIKLVLIGLSPYSFRYDNDKDFAKPKDFQYRLAKTLRKKILAPNFLSNCSATTLKISSRRPPRRLT